MSCRRDSHSLSHIYAHKKHTSMKERQREKARLERDRDFTHTWLTNLLLLWCHWSTNEVRLSFTYSPLKVFTSHHLCFRLNCQHTDATGIFKPHSWLRGLLIPIFCAYRKTLFYCRRYLKICRLLTSTTFKDQFILFWRKSPLLII